jgi:GNAT superfamily N-acetyltransferase
MAKVQVRPVTRANWRDFERLFEAKGSPHYCWCAPYRSDGREHSSNAGRKACMRKLVDAGTPVGVLAYDGDEPIGWCSIAPRESYVKLRRSRTMPRVTAPDTPTWVVLCFFVVRAWRKQRLAHELLKGAVAYARSQGAQVVEGYPFDSAGISATHQGHSSVFEALRFRQDDGERRFALRLRRPRQASAGKRA